MTTEQRNIEILKRNAADWLATKTIETEEIMETCADCGNEKATDIPAHEAFLCVNCLRARDIENDRLEAEAEEHIETFKQQMFGVKVI